MSGPSTDLSRMFQSGGFQLLLPSRESRHWRTAYCSSEKIRPFSSKDSFGIVGSISGKAQFLQYRQHHQSADHACPAPSRLRVFDGLRTADQFSFCVGPACVDSTSFSAEKHSYCHRKSTIGGVVCLLALEAKCCAVDGSTNQDRLPSLILRQPWQDESTGLLEDSTGTSSW